MAGDIVLGKNSYFTTETRIRRLIFAVKKFPCLYDNSTQTYHNNGIKASAWNQVALLCGCSSGKECLQRWKVLRDKYRRTRKKILLHGKSIMRGQPWSLYNIMNFLGPHMIGLENCQSPSAMGFVCDDPEAGDKIFLQEDKKSLETATIVEKITAEEKQFDRIFNLLLENGSKEDQASSTSETKNNLPFPTLQPLPSSLQHNPSDSEYTPVTSEYTQATLECTPVALACSTPVGLQCAASASSSSGLPASTSVHVTSFPIIPETHTKKSSRQVEDDMSTSLFSFAVKELQKLQKEIEKENDPTYKFFKLMAYEASSLPRVMRIELQKEVMELVVKKVKEAEALA